MPFYVEFLEPRATRHSQPIEQIFTVTIRKCHLPEFVVPKASVDQALRSHWYPGMAVKAKFMEEEDGFVVCKEYKGCIIRLSDSSSIWPHSPWDAIEVRWESSAESNVESLESINTDRISSWEIVMSDTSTSPSLDLEFMSRVIEEIESLMTDPKCIDFIDEVNYDIFPDYLAVIPVPMYVKLIYNRLKGDYYRQVYYV
jgi:hypothetical protein